MSIQNKFSDTELCVKCGLCLPHCPTYNKTLNENESPRGRLALIQGWSTGELKTSPKLLEHIDNCLLCRSCERVCPATVPYGRLMDDFRAASSQPKTPAFIRFKLFVLRKILRNKALSRKANTLIHRLHKTGIQSIFRSTNLIKMLGLSQLDTFLSSVKPQPDRPEYYFSKEADLGCIGLFVGCMGNLIDIQTVDAAIEALKAVGYSVYLPDNQSCCGALDLHAGNNRHAADLQEINLTAFNAEKLDAIASIASGCGATLREYSLQQQIPTDASVFSKQVKDISQLIVESEHFKNLALKPLNAKICVHTPCSLKNVMRAESAPIRLLEHIPDIRLYPLPDTAICCGAAGSYMIKHKHMAQSLRQDLLNRIEEMAPDCIVSSNIGCILHLRAGLQEKGLKIEVIHPIELFSRQLQMDQEQRYE